MSKSEYLTAVGIVAAGIMLNIVLDGDRINSRVILIIAVIAILLAIPLYFGTRDRTRPPSGAERIAATVWLWFRRILCFSFGVLLFAAIIIMKDIPFWLALLFAFGGVFIIFTGFVGGKDDGTNWKDNIEHHSQNKDRYDWWF
ncbi:MAG: hypothetical protein FWG81_01495 [Betaproteobacteria bacterium]|nr:hypothetical protein [Betaproteobacteria bacterium]